jgi:hypothetical protein
MRRASPGRETERPAPRVGRAAGRHHIAALAGLVLVGTLSSTARADAKKPGRSKAEALFDEGRALYDSGKFDLACAKLAESDAAEPAIGTMGLLASCEESRGKLARAYAHFLEAAERARRANDKRLTFALDSATRLTTRLATLVIDARRPGGVTIARDGVVVHHGELGLGVLVDPGEVEIVARTDGASWSTKVKLVGGQRTNVSVPDLEGATAEEQPLRRLAGEPSRPLRTLGLVIGAAGLGGLFAGVGLGISAADQGGKGLPSAPTLTDATIVTLVAGGVVLLAGGALVTVDLATAKKRTSSARVEPRLSLELGAQTARATLRFR